MGTGWTGLRPSSPAATHRLLYIHSGSPLPLPLPNLRRLPEAGMTGGCETEGVGDLGKGREGGTTDGWAVGWAGGRILDMISGVGGGSGDLDGCMDE